MERTTGPTVEASHRIAQVLGALSSYLYCEDDDVADVIWAWGQFTLEGRASAKKSVLGLVAGGKNGIG